VSGNSVARIYKKSLMTTKKLGAYNYIYMKTILSSDMHEHDISKKFKDKVGIY